MMSEQEADTNHITEKLEDSAQGDIWEVEALHLHRETPYFKIW